TSPVDGAVVPAGIEPTVSFSEPVDPSSLAAGISLHHDGRIVELDFNYQGALVTVLPLATLPPGSEYELRIGYGVRDQQGYMLANPVTVGFSTQAAVLPTSVDRSKIHLVEPDAAGMATIVGEPGAVPSSYMVWIENLSSYVSTPSTNAGGDGSFQLTIESSVTDRLLFHVLMEGANEIGFFITPFMSADRRRAWVGAEGSRFTTVDDITVIVEEGTFEELTPVRVEPLPLDDPPPAPLLPEEDFDRVYSFDIDFGGVKPQKPIQLRVPAPAEAEPGWYLVARPVQILGQSLWSLKDIMVLDGEYLTNEPGFPAKGRRTRDRFLKADPGAPVVSITEPPDGGVFSNDWPVTFTATAVDDEDGDLADDILWISNREGLLHTGGSFVSTLPSLGVHTITASVSDSDHYQASDSIELMIHDELDPREYKVGIVTGDSYNVFAGRHPIGWAICTISEGGAIFNDQIPGMSVEARDARDSVAGFHQLAVPLLLGQEFEIVGLDMTTGYEIFRQVLEPQTEEVVMLPKSVWGDKAPPWPRAGAPLRFYVLETIPGVTKDIAAGISMTMTETRGSSGELDAEQTLSVSFAPGALGIDSADEVEDRQRQVRIFGLRDGSVETRTIDQAGETVSREVSFGDPYLLMIGAAISGDAWIEIGFNEALLQDLSGFELYRVE
ncbi:MAG: Ig-like domain-containing protein, partial [bacterium]|nr:Ig-like domain-containing protein [bacterium]